MGWILSTEERAKLEVLKDQLEQALDVPRKNSPWMLTEFRLRANLDGMDIPVKIATLPHAELIEAISHLTAAAAILAENKDQMSDEKFNKLGEQFVNAADRLGDKDGEDTAACLQNTLAVQLVTDIDATVNPPKHDYDYDMGDLWAAAKCFQLAQKLCRELSDNVDEF